MTGATDFTKLVPGFDFLQSLMKGADAWQRASLFDCSAAACSPTTPSMPNDSTTIATRLSIIVTPRWRLSERLQKERFMAGGLTCGWQLGTVQRGRQRGQ